MDMKNANNRGSVWRKWDLHVHAPGTKKNDQYVLDDEGDILDEFCKRIEASDVAVVGIADYFSAKSYFDVRDRFEKLYPNSNKKLFLNIELCTSDVVNKAQEEVNLHLIFNPNLKDLKNKISIFLANLKTNKTDAVKRNIRCSELTNKSDFESATTTRDFIESAIEETFGKKINRSDHCLIFTCANNDGIRTETEEVDGKKRGKKRKAIITDELDKFSQGFFGNSSNTSHFLVTKRLTDSDDELDPKPVISGSDSHSFTDLDNWLGKKFISPDGSTIKEITWIKADTSYEGLKQILHEPKYRVRICDENPEQLETFSKINALEILLPDDLAIVDKDTNEKTDFCLSGKYSIQFSNNLTCIIGGRGSGKSTFAHILYNAWINKNISKLSLINSPLINIGLTPNPLAQIEKITKTNIPENVEFYFQNEVEESAKNIGTMSTMIKQRLLKLSSITGDDLKKLEDEWRLSAEALDDLIKSYDEIVRIEKDSEELRFRIETLKTQTEVMQSEEYKKLQLELAIFTKELTDFKRYEDNHTEVVKNIDSLTKILQALEWNPDQGAQLIGNLLKDLERHKELLETKHDEILLKRNKNSLQSKIDSKKDELKVYLANKGLSAENIQELANANITISELQEKRDRLKDECQPYYDIFLNKTGVLDNYIKSFSNYFNRFIEVTTTLENRLVNLSFLEKELKFIVKRNYEKLENIVIDFIKSRYDGQDSLHSDVIKNLVFGVGEEIEELCKDKLNIKENISKSIKKSSADKHGQILQELIEQDTFLEQLYLRFVRMSFDLATIQTLTTLGGNSLKNTSFGERCGIVMSIILIAGTSPLIIDQPEDHLDGKFISKVLVPLLKDQKQNRQIILITRDANIVVGGDSELIHILETASGHTRVFPSSLERTDKRENYIWILDGGKEAFAKRERKYNSKYSYTS